MSLEVCIMLPEEVICKTSTEEVIIPTSTGQLGIKEGHTRMVSALDIGIIRFKVGEKWVAFITPNKGAAVIKNNNVLIFLKKIESIPKQDYEKAKNDVALAYEKVLQNNETKSKTKKSEDGANLKLLRARLVGLKYVDE
jgi:F-type H+-transporting ATPase subunit epsilon